MDTTTVEAVEAGPSQEWFDAHRTTPEQLETATWAEERTSDIAASRALKDTLGLEHGAYSKQLEALSSEERVGLKGKTPEEIAEALEARAEAGRELEKLEKQAKAQAEENFEGAETPHLREVRKAMKTAYKEAGSLDKRIAELQRINELRDNPSAEGWEDLSSEQWREAREGNMESFNGEIANLIQEKQAKLQEAALHQNAYHEESRSRQPQFVPDRPIGQIVGSDGRPMSVIPADIQGIVQMERDEQAHEQRVMEAHSRYADWDQAFRNIGDLPIRNEHMAFVKSLPNSADVAYYLATHPNEAVALVQMPNHDAMRTLIGISHKAVRPSAAPRTTTSAPKPPSPVGGASSRTFDVNDDSLSADEWMRQRNRQLDRRKG